MSTMTKKAQAAAEREEAIAQLRAMFPIGTSVPIVLRHVSSSGMTRAISVLDPVSLRDVSYLVAKATGDRLHPTKPGVRVGDCGMDMGFALVYGLARTLYRDGFPCLGQPHRDGFRCPSNDHSNEWKAPDFTPGRLHSDPGYALSQRWI